MLCLYLPFCLVLSSVFFCRNLFLVTCLSLCSYICLSIPLFFYVCLYIGLTLVRFLSPPPPFCLCDTLFPSFSLLSLFLFSLTFSLFTLSLSLFFLFVSLYVRVAFCLCNFLFLSHSHFYTISMSIQFFISLYIYFCQSLSVDLIIFQSVLHSYLSVFVSLSIFLICQYLSVGVSFHPFAYLFHYMCAYLSL